MSIGIGLHLGLMGRVGGGRSPSAWYDEAFDYRVPVTVPNSNGVALTDYQVNVPLTSGFDFASCQSDGSDLRVTDSDGQTLLPYWVESFNPGGTSGSIWARVPTIPDGGTTLWLYYANPSPVAFDIPPLGPFAKVSGNPVIAGGTTTGKLIENIAYDSATSTYWMCYTDRQTARSKVGMASSSDLVTWSDAGVIFDNNGLGAGTGADSPHLIKDGSTWYLFFHNSTSVHYATSSTPNGTYTVNTTAILTPSALTGAGGGDVGWETQRVTEVFVHKRDTDNVWCLWYMGDRGTAAQSCGGFTQNNQEQNGLATAPAITGPYTKDPNNPIIKFGATNEIDSCTVADPWIIKCGDRWYQGYAAGKVGSNNPWSEAVAWSDDYVTWHKAGIILGQGSRKIASPNAWDDFNAHRGAMHRFGDTYYLTYAGLNKFGTALYQGGIATQSAVSSASGFPPQQVFGFYEDFSAGTALPSHLRADVGFATYAGSNPVPSSGADTVISSGVAGLRSGRAAITVRPHVKILSVQEFGPDWMVEARAKHASADGTATYASAIGFGNDNYDPVPKPLFVAGKFSNGYQYTGSRFNAAFGNPSALQINGQATPITVECWVKLNSNRAGTSVILSKNSGWMLYLTGNSSNTGKINISYNGATIVSTSSNVITGADIGVWVHIAFTYTTDGVTGVTHIYKDGVDLALTGTFNAAISTGASLYLGQRGDNANWIDGIVDEVRISNNLRYTSGFTPSASAFTSDGNTVALWHLDESSGSSVADSGPNGIAGTITARGEDATLTTAMGAAIHAHENANFLKSTSNRDGDESAMATAVDTSYHVHKVWWVDASTVKFALDSGSWETLTTHMPVGSLPAYAGVSVRNDNAVAGSLDVDWMRVRRMAATDPVLSVGSAET